MQEIVKFFLALLMLQLSGGTRKAIDGWSLSRWITVAIVPAALYSLQNMCALVAYQNLDALTFNVLNQTKTLSAALCVYLIMGRKQSKVQAVALMILLLSALVMEKIVTVEFLLGSESEGEEKEDTNTWDTHHFTHGVAPILMASFISGLAGALTQRNLQSAGGGRNAYFFSMELCVGSVILLGLTLLVSPDGEQIHKNGFFDGWTPETFIPIVINSIGGILVGLVTKHAGSVRKGFALIFGILLSGLLQEVSSGGVGVSKEQLLGGILAALSLWMHATNPPSTPAKPVVETAAKKED